MRSDFENNGSELETMTHDYIKSLLERGLNIIPLKSDKSPKAGWGKYETLPVETVKESDHYGLICGFADVECIDVDLKVLAAQEARDSFFDDLIAEIKEVLPDYKEKLVIKKTRTSGYHLVYQAENHEGNTKLARLKDKTEAIIETRGAGGYICMYSTGINGKDYRDIQYITNEQRDNLINVCRVFNEVPEAATAAPAKYNNDLTTPWGDYNDRTDIWDIVSDEFEIFREMGDKTIIKRNGAGSPYSGYIYKDSGCMFLFSTGTIYEAQKLISPFAAYTVKNHGGDYKKAAGVLRAEGYGQPPVVGIRPEDYLVNLADNIPDPEPILKIGGVLVASPGNLLTIKAKQKGGKGFCISILIASLFRGEYFGIEGFRHGRIALIDFEQSINQVHKVYRRTHVMSGLPVDQGDPDLMVYYASELDTDERWSLFEQICEEKETSIVILDTSTDLISDINDAARTKAEVDKFQAIAKRTKKLIIATIHENKGDTNATGHFGGSLQKKSETVISVIKSEGFFTVTGTDTRHGDWPDFSFIIDEKEYPQSMEAPVKLSSKELKELSIVGNMRRSLAGGALSNAELVKKYRAHQVCSPRTAQRHIKDALDRDWIKVASDNKYMLVKSDDDEDLS